jgi:hypothetical protein
MKNLCAASAAICGLLLAAPAGAQLPNLWQITISGVSWTTNSAGQIGAEPLNNGTLLKHIADVNGTTDYSWWALAYHVGGNDLGDTIDIINRTNGTTLQTLFGLYFGEAFERSALLSASHRQMKRIEYIYTDQSPHSIGSALMTDYYFFDKAGNTNYVVVLGQMQWLVVPDNKNPKMRVNSASFTTTRPLKFSR